MLPIDQKIEKLQNHLQRASSRSTKQWFESYLKNTIQYRGVKTPIVERLLSRWRNEESLDDLPILDQVKVARRLIEQRYAEDKFTGTIFACSIS
jgi:hypothetical protein